MTACWGGKNDALDRADLLGRDCVCRSRDRGPELWDHLTRIWDHLNKQSVRGSIILNSPTIYTRQRLVNDRLSQADWLSEQLKMTETEKARDFKLWTLYQLTLIQTK